MVNSLTASLLLPVNQTYSVDSTADSAIATTAVDKTVTDKLYGTLGEVNTNIPALRTITSYKDGTASAMSDARSNGVANLKLADVVIKSFTFSSIKGGN